MTVRTPPGVLNTESTDSAVQRDVHRSLLGGALTSFAGGVGAVNGAAHGVCGDTHLAVTQSATPAMSVDVAAGSAFITGTASALQGPYNMVNDAAVTLAIAAADATNPRHDLVIAQIRDNTYDGSGFRDARLTVVTGTPAASPSDPSLSAYPNALVLARVTVAALASSITNANITDLRTTGGWQTLTRGEPWTSFTPTWTGLSPGNADQEFAYRYSPGGMTVVGRLVFGSSTSISGNVSMAVPNGESAALNAFGSAMYNDFLSRFYQGGVLVFTGSPTSLSLTHAEAGNAGEVNATAPFTWTTTDAIYMHAFVPL